MPQMQLLSFSCDPLVPNYAPPVSTRLQLPLPLFYGLLPHLATGERTLMSSRPTRLPTPLSRRYRCQIVVLQCVTGSCLVHGTKHGYGAAYETARVTFCCLILQALLILNPSAVEKPTVPRAVVPLITGHALHRHILPRRDFAAEFCPLALLVTHAVPDWHRR